MFYILFLNIFGGSIMYSYRNETFDFFDALKPGSDISRN